MLNEAIPVENPIDILTTSASNLPVPPSGLGYTAAEVYFGGIGSAVNAAVAAGSSDFAPAVFGNTFPGEQPIEFLGFIFANNVTLQSTIGQGGIYDEFCFPSPLLTGSSYTFLYYNSSFLIGTQAATIQNGCLFAAFSVSQQHITPLGGLGIVVATP